MSDPLAGGTWNGLVRGDRVTLKGTPGIFKFYRFNEKTERVELFDGSGGIWEFTVGDAYEKIRRA